MRTFTKKEVYGLMTGVAIVAVILGSVVSYLGAKAWEKHNNKTMEQGYNYCIQQVVQGVQSYGYINVPNGEETITLIPYIINEESSDLN